MRQGYVKHLFNRKGVTLIEALIAIGISAALVMPTAYMFYSMNSGMTTLNGQYNWIQFKTALSSRLWQAACLQTINSAVSPTAFDPANAPTPAGQYLNINLGDNIPLVNSANPTPVPQYNIAYEYVKFENAVNVGADPSNSTWTMWKGQIAMKIDRYAQFGSNQAPQLVMMPEQILGSLQISVDGTNTIQACEMNVPVMTACGELNGAEIPGNYPSTCQVTFPCQGGANYFVSGYDGSGNQTCTKTVSTCPSGQGLIADGVGGFTCQSFYYVE